MTNDSLSDSDLIARSHCEPSVFKELFERHFDDLFRYLAHRAGSGAAEDLAAETFTIAFAKRSSYAPMRPSARPWLFAIATNLLRERARKERRGRFALGRLMGRDEGQAPDDGPASDEREDARAEHARLWAALRGIRQEERDALLLYAWADLTYAEIAIATGCPIGTVRSRISRARIALASSLSHLDPSYRPDPLIEVSCDSH